MTADPLLELAARADPPPLQPAGPPPGGALEQLAQWARSTRPDPPGGLFAAPLVLVCGGAADDPRRAELLLGPADAPAALRCAAVPVSADGDPARSAADAVDAAVDTGADLLVLIADGSAADRQGAAALVSVLARIEPARLVDYAGPRDDAAWMARLAAVRDARRVAAAHRGAPAEALRALARPALTAAAAALLAAAGRRTPVLLDGPLAAAAALTAGSLRPGAARWWLAVATGAPGEAAIAARIGLPTPLDLPGGGPPGAAASVALHALAVAVRAADPAAIDPAPPTMPVPDADPSRADGAGAPATGRAVSA